MAQPGQCLVMLSPQLTPCPHFLLSLARWVTHGHTLLTWSQATRDRDQINLKPLSSTYFVKAVLCSSAIYVIFLGGFSVSGKWKGVMCVCVTKFRGWYSLGPPCYTHTSYTSCLLPHPLLHPPCYTHTSYTSSLWPHPCSPNHVVN